MKAFDELNFKADVSYTKTHEWAKKNGNVGGYTATDSPEADFIELNAMDIGYQGDN